MNEVSRINIMMLLVDYMTAKHKKPIVLKNFFETRIGVVWRLFVNFQNKREFSRLHSLGKLYGYIVYENKIVAHYIHGKEWSFVNEPLRKLFIRAISKNELGGKKA